MFNGLLSNGPVNLPAKFEVRSFTRSLDNSDWSFGFLAEGCEAPILGKVEAVGGRGWYRPTVQKSVGEFL